MEIAWEDIKDGFRGFERLALIFARKHFPNPSWKKTGETRDGNTDAIAYVFGYRSSDKQQIQWWMEAKYSTERALVTRYRLDATIVSAILAGNVKKVVFITNIAIRAKTILDIRNALTKATSCYDVQFCTKSVLENWLCENPSIYQDFFSPLALGESLEQSEALYLTQEIDFYRRSSDSVVFAEPCRIMYGNECYVGHFSVYCADNRTVTLRKNRRCRGVSIKGKRSFQLHPGDNPIRFEIVLSPEPPDERSFYFLLDNIEVFPSGFVRLSQQRSIYCELPGQKEITEHIRKALKQFLKKNGCAYYAISAASGSGKTEMLEQLLADPLLTNEYLFYRSFSFSDIDNSLLFVDLILFLLFPYLAPGEINSNYLERLGNAHTINQVHKLIRLRNDYNGLVDFLMQKCTPEDFLPHDMRVNARIICLDNVHGLSDSLFFFFEKLLVELQNREVPVFMILTVDESTLYQNRWIDLRSHCNITVYHFQLSLEDIMVVMGGSLQIKDTTRILLQSDSLTAVELFAFAQYILSESNEIETVEQLLAALRIFQYSDVWGKDIRAKFIKLFDQYPECRALCDMVFSSYAPVQIRELPSPGLTALLENGLMRYDLYNRLIPRNEVVRECYRANFEISLRQNDAFISKEDRLRITLENERSPAVLCEAAREIIALTNEKQYNSVIYIGKAQFEHDAARHMLESRMRNQVLFFQIYFSYSYAAHMQSNVQNPRSHFERIIARCKRTVDVQLTWLCLRAQWELANNNFENLCYHEVLEDVQAGIVTLKKLRNLGAFVENIDTCLKFYDFMAIKSLVQSELERDTHSGLSSRKVKDSMAHGFTDRYYNTKIRLALTKIVVNTQESYEALKEGIQYFEKRYDGNHKMYLFGEFSRLYYDMVFRNHPALIKPLTAIHERMKMQQHNNYRKRNFAMATYYYWMGDIETGNRYLFSEIFMVRNLSQRARGFYHETMALYELREHKPQQAIRYLRKAQEIFASVISYAQIPKHNISVLETTPVEKTTITFWKGDSFLPNTYYLDLRITW